MIKVQKKKMKHKISNILGQSFYQLIFCPIIILTITYTSSMLNITEDCSIENVESVYSNINKKILWLIYIISRLNNFKMLIKKQWNKTHIKIIIGLNNYVIIW